MMRLSGTTSVLGVEEKQTSGVGKKEIHQEIIKERQRTIKLASMS